MQLHTVIGDMHFSPIHNPRHFYSHSFDIETAPNGRLLVTGKCRLKHKNYRIVGILKPPKNHTE